MENIFIVETPITPVKGYILGTVSISIKAIVIIQVNEFSRLTGNMFFKGIAHHQVK